MLKLLLIKHESKSLTLPESQGGEEKLNLATTAALKNYTKIFEIF